MAKFHGVLRYKACNAADNQTTKGQQDDAVRMFLSKNTCGREELREWEYWSKYWCGAEAARWLQVGPASEVTGDDPYFCTVHCSSLPFPFQPGWNPSHSTASCFGALDGRVP